MKKKLICWLLVLAIVFTCMPTALAADEPEKTDAPYITDPHDSKDGAKMTAQSAGDWEDQRSVTYLTDGDWKYYVNSDDTATITAYLGSNTDITTPTTVGGKNVSIIGAYTFEGMTDITSVTISEGIEQLGDDIWGDGDIYGSIFSDCLSLTTVNLPSTLETLATDNFAYTRSLATITVAPANTNFRIVDGVLFSGAGGANLVLECYPRNKSGTSYTIPSSVETIAPHAFCWCAYLQELTIPSSVTQSYDGVFNCNALTTVTIQEGVTSIGGFGYCPSLTTVHLPNTLKSLEAWAFERCENLTGITLPNGLVNIYWGAFECSGLQSINIPVSAANIESTAFCGCWDLTSINIDSSNAYYKSVDGVLFTKDGGWLTAYPCGKSGSSYTVPDGTAVISDDAFYYAGLEQVNLPDSLSTIWSGAFDSSRLTNISIPKGVKSIYWRAFQGTNLTTVSIPSNVEFIGYGAFSSNPNLSRFIVYNDSIDYDSYDDVFYDSPNVVLCGRVGSTTQTYAQQYNLPFSPIATAISLDTASTTLISTGTGKLTATTTPNGAEVTWSSSNASIVSVDASGNLKANAAGTAIITAASYDQSASCTVTVNALNPLGISCSKADATVYGAANGSVTVSASGGNSGSYEYSINNGASWQGSGTFGGLAAGTYTAVVRDAIFPSNTAAQTVSVGQPAYMGTVPAKKVSTKANAGTALTIAPPAAPKGYTVQSTTFTSSNPAVATVDGSGTVSFVAGGKVTIITKVVSTTVDKKGRIKTKTTTVKKTITVKQPVASISLNLGSTTIARTQKVKLIPSVAPATASNKKVKWTSSNKKVATVSGAGVVVGKAGGTAVITCTAADGSRVIASCTVNVTPIYPTAIKVSKAALTVKTGKSASLKATITPKNTDFKTVTWASSNAAVATVDAKGKIKGISPGTAVITATTSSGQTASSTVTVK